MKKLVLSVVLVNLLAACGAIHTPFGPMGSSSSTKQDSAAETPKVETATTPNLNTTPLNNGTLEVPVASDPAPKAEAAASAVAPAAEASAAAPKTEPIADTSGSLSKRSVYFPYDSDAIQDADKTIIEAHGAYLSGHPEIKVRTEGNADERGSSEYNLALGQRRANHAKKALVLSGATVDQVEAISYGEEKPLATGHDETSWAQNRRTDINYIK